jgi:hypothetical protein
LTSQRYGFLSPTENSEEPLWRNLREDVEAQFKELGAGLHRHAGIKLKKSPGGFRETHSRPSFSVNGDKFKKGFGNKQPPLTLP